VVFITAISRTLPDRRTPEPAFLISKPFQPAMVSAKRRQPGAVTSSAISLPTSLPRGGEPDLDDVALRSGALHGAPEFVASAVTAATLIDSGNKSRIMAGF